MHCNDGATATFHFLRYGVFRGAALMPYAAPGAAKRQADALTLPLVDVLENGYWHARSLAYTGGGLARLLEWCRMPGDLVFIAFGAVPIAIVAVRAYLNGKSDVASMQARERPR